MRFEVEAPAVMDVLDCNCSICRMTRYPQLIVSASRFRLLSGVEALTQYAFNTRMAKRHFCRHCGITSC